MARMLLLGGTGFIGPHVIRMLIDRGHKVGVFHRGVSNPQVPRSVVHITGNRNHLREHRDALLQFRAEVVIDFIAGTEAQATSLRDLFAGNVRRAVVLSSGDVYRAYDVLCRKISGPLEPVPLTEDSPTRGTRYPYRGIPLPPAPWMDLNEYDKVLVEDLLLADPRLPTTVLRLPFVYGPGDYIHRWSVYLKRMDDRRPVILLDQATAGWHGPWGYVENIAEAVVLAAEDVRRGNHLYNVGEQDAPSFEGWLQLLANVIRWPGEVRVVPGELPPPSLASTRNLEQDFILDSSRIRGELGYEEVVGRHEALQRTIEWERQNPPCEINPVLFDYAAEDALIARLSMQEKWDGAA